MSQAFADAGCDTVSFDLLPSPGKLPHIQGDFFSQNVVVPDLIFAFPPCTYLAKAGLHFNLHSYSRRVSTVKAFEFVLRLYFHACPRIIIENPIGWLNTHWRKPSQILSPLNFGDAYHKEICLWSKGLPPIVPPFPSISTVNAKRLSNHVNGRMSQVEKSKIKSSWSRFPKMSTGLAQFYTSVILNS